MNWNGKLISKFGLSMFVTLAVLMLLTLGSMPASGQACAAQNWTASTPNIWASDGSVKVMLNNSSSTNQPTIPIYADDGAYNPWGFEQHPQTLPELNTVWSCPSPAGTPVIAIAGAGRETVSFQVYVSAGVGANSALGSVNLTVSPLNGPGATITSDNTGSSAVNRYLEGYVPYTSPGPNNPMGLQATGQMPDPLIPFYDPYDAGNPAVATPFNVQSGTTQAVWVNVSIPANQTAGAYTGTVTLTGDGVGAVAIPVTLTVWNGNLPTFDAGSVNPQYADMLKTWLPFYRGNFDKAEGVPYGGPGDAQEQALYQKYLVMGHNYDIDVQIDVDGPANSGCYGPSGSQGCTSFTTDGTTSSLDWTAYDAYVGPALTPGGLFSDGTNMRTFDSPLSTAGGGAWHCCGWQWTEQNGGASVPPDGMLQLVNNYASQISQHFAANHLSKGWGVPELISYTFDETYNFYHSKDIGGNERIYEIISAFNAAINSSNSALSATWDPSTFPVRTFLTDAPHCQEQGDNPYFTDLACSDHINLSYPGATNSTPGYTNSWVADWTPNASLFMPGQPGPALNYGWTAPPTPLTMGTGYQYTFDLTQGVPALSTAPAPIERWTYVGGDPFDGGVGPGANGVGPRVNYWIAYKYELDVTVPSVGNPNPPPAPGGIWIWVGDWWSGYEGGASPSDCAGGAPSPFVTASDGDDGVVFYPGNEVGCYYTANPVGEAVLTASPAVNTSCTSSGYTVCNGISGPVASIRMEEMRRGYEDYEYLYLLGKRSGRAAAMAIANSIGSDGMASWGAMNWEDVDGSWYAMGLLPVSAAYTGNCTDPTPGAGGLPNGLPNGPTGAASSGLPNYGGCPGLWSSDPSVYEAARVQMAQELGFAPANAAPTITGLNPSSGLNSGGTSVVITGTNFTGATEVQFGGVDVASYVINSATQITAVTNAGNGTVDVQVFGPGGGSLPNSSDQYSYVSPVTVTGVSPNQGVQVGGNTVTITGTYFATGAIVMFGDSQCTIVGPVSPNLLKCIVPPGVGTVQVTVTTAQGTSSTNPSDLYTYEPPPTVSGIVPPNGLIAGGYGVTINGTGFTNVVAVYFGAKPAINFIALSSADIAATVPPGVSMSGGVVDVTVVTADGTSAITGADQFDYLSPVTVTAISPVTGPPAGGTQVIITGTDFTGASAVNFGGNPATFTVNSATQITATSPAGGGTVDITVTTPPYSSGPTSADLFSYSSAVAGGAFATLPTTAVGSTSAPQNVQVTLQSASAISGITVPMSQNGVAEFTIGTVTGCSLGGSVNPSGTVCTVPVSFSPQYPGLRTGMLTINNAGDVVGTAGLTGIGLGPEVAISPGALNMSIGGGVYGVTATPQSVTTAALSVSNNFSALAIDGSGNMYIADNINCLAYKVNFLTNQIVTIAGNYTFAAGAVLPSTTPIPALGSATCPIAIAVDGAGNVFVADANIAVNDAGTYDSPYPGVVEEISAATGEIVIVAGNPNSSLTATTTPQSALSVAIQAVNSLTTDAAGNLYISDFFNNLVEKVTPDGNIVVVAGSGGPGGGGPGGPFTTPQPATSVYLNGPTGMVVDASGNLYISDQNINLIEQVNAAGNIITVAGGGGSTPSTTPQPAPSVAFNAPGELAVDGAGNLYIADILNSEVEQLNLAGQLAVVAGGGAIVPTSAVQSSLTASLGLIEGVEVDGAGNIYIADGQNIGNGDNMIEKVSTLAAPLNFPYTNEGTNSAPQWLTLANIGNQSLTLSSLSSPPDYPLQSTGTCTVTANNPQTLTTGSSCSVAYLLDPINAGILNETATLIDNNLNASISQQVISFTGAAIGGTVDTPTFSPAAGTYLTSQSVTISDATVGATVYYTTDGSAPTTNSMIYSSPIPVPASMLIQALSADNGANSSTVASAAYTINNPAPVVSNLSPAIASAGGAAFTLTVNGSGYIPSSTVYWGSSALATTYVSATELTAQVTAANVASAGITAVTVQSPAPGGGTSNAFQFEVDSAASGTAQITTGTYTVAPGSTAGYAAVPPSGTTIVSVQCLNLPAGATCSYQSALGLLNIATSATTPAGTYQITAVFTLTEPGAASGFIFLPILLLPLVLLRRKLAARGVWANAFLGLILLVGAAVACTGCGGGGSLTQTHQVTSSGTVTLTIT